MKWIEWLCIVLWLFLIGGVQLWKAKVPEKSATASNLTIFLIVLAVIGGVIKITYSTLQKPSKKEVEETKRKDAEAASDIFIAKLHELFPDNFLNPERTSEQKEYIIKGIERAKSDDPNKVLEDLIQQEKEIDSKIKENINDLIQRNKEITVIAQSEGKLEIAIDAANKILEYAPKDSFAFRERGFVNHRLGKIEQAEKDFIKGVDTSVTDIEKASALVGVGIFYSRIGQYQKAEEYLKSAYKIGKEIPNSMIIAASSLNLSNLYVYKNDTNSAKLYISEAIVELEKTGDKKRAYVCAM